MQDATDLAAAATSGWSGGRERATIPGMKCQKCLGREATLHATQYVDGKECSVHLCIACAISEGFDPANPMSIGAILENALSRQSLLARTAAEEDAPDTDAARCPACGTTLADARGTGKFGCPACYEAFRATAERALALGRAGRKPYRGKIPPMADAAEALSARRARFARLLDEAVAAERYEEAARLRDALAALDGGAAGGGDAP
ncbi:MAG: UvrB/UvrC motif-containing protein [Kiritimatiellae bacterium]|nr:UvrB/UvrC motif-containing protein [Kiritimatiellia bacterium]